MPLRPMFSGVTPYSRRVPYADKIHRTVVEYLMRTRYLILLGAVMLLVGVFGVLGVWLQ